MNRVSARKAVRMLVEERLIRTTGLHDEFSIFAADLIDDYLFGNPDQSTQDRNTRAATNGSAMEIVAAQADCESGPCDGPVASSTANHPSCHDIRTAVSQSRCYACGDPSLKGHGWCAVHDPDRKPATSLEGIGPAGDGEQQIPAVAAPPAASSNGHAPDPLLPIAPRPGASSEDRQDPPDTGEDKAREYIVALLQAGDAPVGTAGVMALTGMSRSQAASFIKRVQHEVDPNSLAPDASARSEQTPAASPQAVGLAGGGIGGADKKREDSAFYAARKAAKERGQTFDEAEWRSGYRSRQAAAART